MMQELTALLGILAALAVGVVSPGPSFVMVARTAVAASRRDAIAAALGMGAGGVVFAVAALLGLHALLLAVPASVFAAFLPGSQSLAFALALVVLVFAIETGWYSLVALALASDRPRSAYLRYKSWADRLAGGVMVALGLKLVSSAQR